MSPQIPDGIEALRDMLEAGMSPFPGTCLIPAGYKLESTERFKGAPDELRGIFEAESIEEFVRYASDPDLVSLPRIFVDPRAMCALGRLDHGDIETPYWGRHQAKLKLPTTPAWDAFLLARASGGLSQSELIDFIADWPEHLAFSTAGADAPWDAMTPAAAIQAIRKLITETRRDAIHTENDTGRERTTFERAAVSSAPPLLLRWAGEPYEELGERQVLARLSYLPQDPPKIRLRPIGFALLQKALAEAFRDRLCAALPEAARVHIGVFTPVGER